MKRKSLLVAILFLMATIFALAGVACTSSSSKKPTFYTISFDTMGGNEIPSVQVEQGQCIEEPETPVKVGYSFNCWYYDFAEFDFATPVYEDMELIANWSAKTDIAYSINVFVSGEDKTADYTKFFGVMKATTGKTVNVSSVATRILESLSGYYLDTKNVNSLLETTIAGDGSTVFNLYFEELVAEGNVLACYTSPISAEGISAVVSNDAGYVRDGEQAVLKITATESLTEIPFNVNPENKDWSSYDYISYYVYNATSATVWAEKGGIIYRNQWNLITVDLHETSLGDLTNVQEFSNKIYCEWNVAQVGLGVQEGEVFYISNIVGKNYNKEYTDADNVIYKFEEEVGALSKYYTIPASDYYNLSYATVDINNTARQMTRVNIMMQAAEMKYHTIYLGLLSSNDTTMRGFTFDIYNENDYAIFVADNEIPAKSLKSITVKRNQVEYFGDGGFLLYAVDGDGAFLPMGASYCIGNFTKNLIGTQLVNYTVKVFVQNDSNGEYEDKTAEFDFGDCRAYEFSEVNIVDKAAQLTPYKHYFNRLYEGTLVHVFELVEGTEFAVYYTYTDYVAPNYYRVEGRGQLSLDYSFANDGEVCSYKIDGTNCWTSSEEEKETQIFFTDEAWQAYQEALAQDPEISKIVFYVVETTGYQTNCNSAIRLIDGEQKDGDWVVGFFPVSQQYFTKVELTIEQFTKIYNGYGYYLNFACWADGHTAYLSQLYFE